MRALGGAHIGLPTILIFSLKLEAMRRFQINTLFKFLYLLICTCFVSGCAGTKNWTDYFQNQPAKLKEHPRFFNTPILGGVYELKKDQLLIEAPGKNRYRLSGFGAAGLPRSPEDYFAGRGNQKGVYGVMRAGTKIRGVKVEKYVSSSPSVATRQGVIYEIMNGPHEGKLMPGIIPLVENDLTGNSEPMDPAMLKQKLNPELVHEIRPPYLDIREKRVNLSQ